MPSKKSIWLAAAQLGRNVRHTSLSFVSRLRYGENQRQEALVYKERGVAAPFPLEEFTRMGLLEWSEVSENSLYDINQGIALVSLIAAVFLKNFGEVPYISVVMKHGNACGAAIGETGDEAIRGMIEGNPQAAFGGTVVTNFWLEDTHANLLRMYYGKGKDSTDQNTVFGKRVISAIVGPEISKACYATLFRKKQPLIALTHPGLDKSQPPIFPTGPQRRQLSMLGVEVHQEADTYILDLADDRILFEGDDPARIRKEARNIALAWAVCARSVSNTITLAQDGRIVGNGVGGQDRVGVARSATDRLPKDVKSHTNIVAVSDSFFPVIDSPWQLWFSGVRTILTTYGSERDREVARFCRDNGITLAWLPDKVGRLFHHG